MVVWSWGEVVWSGGGDIPSPHDQVTSPHDQVNSPPMVRGQPDPPHHDQVTSPAEGSEVNYFPSPPPKGQRSTTPKGQRSTTTPTHIRELRSMCGRYASYWNAILFHYFNTFYERDRSHFRNHIMNPLRQGLQYSQSLTAIDTSFTTCYQKLHLFMFTPPTSLFCNIHWRI